MACDKDIENVKEERTQTARLLGINRYVISDRYQGINTVVYLHGCNLRCRYCTKKQCRAEEDVIPLISVEELYAQLLKHDIYYRATGGGIVFSGGEPCLYCEFIRNFRRLCGSKWRISVETSLNVDRTKLEELVGIVDNWIIDSKARDTATYLEYTGAHRQTFINNLWWLIEDGKTGVERSSVRILVPVIPDYVDESTAKESAGWFRTRFPESNVDIIEYSTIGNDTMCWNTLCNSDILQDIRREIVEICEGDMAESAKSVLSFCNGSGLECDADFEAYCKEHSDILASDVRVSSGLLEKINQFDSESDKFQTSDAESSETGLKQPIRAMCMTPSGMCELEHSLYYRGIVAMDWSEILNRNSLLPIIGERMVVLSDIGEGRYCAYLLRVLSVGKNANQYLDNTKFTGSEKYVILTNVAGPVTFTNLDLRLPDTTELTRVTAACYLPVGLSESLLRIFKRQRASNIISSKDEQQ